MPGGTRADRITIAAFGGGRSRFLRTMASLVPTLFLTLWAEACRGREDDTARGGAPAGAVAATADLQIRELFRLGTGDGSAEGDVFARVGAVEMDDAGNVYVLDVEEAVVHVYDHEGRHVRSLGGRGEGPGEFRQPLSLLVAPDGHLWVFDYGAQRYTEFATDGAVAGTYKASFVSGGLVSWIVEPARGEAPAQLYAATNIRKSMGDVVDVYLRVELGERVAAAVDTLARPTREPDAWLAEQKGRGPRIGVPSRIPIPFAPQSRDRLDPRGGYWSGMTDRLRFVWRSWEGDTLKVVERQQEPRPVTPAERDRAIQDLIDDFGSVFTPHPDRVPAVMPFWKDFFVDSEGRLWVERFRPRYDRATHPVWEGYDGDGTYLGALELPVATVPSPAVRGDRVAGVIRDGLGVESVAVYQLVGGGS